MNQVREGGGKPPMSVQESSRAGAATITRETEATEAPLTRTRGVTGGSDVKYYKLLLLLILLFF